MDVKQLQCFVLAVEVGNFTRASEKMNIAQSAFSRHISNLESEIGVELFVRKGRGVEPSPDGIIVYERARKLLSDFRAFSRDVSAKKHAPAARIISMSAHGGVGPLFLSRIARSMKRSDDHVRFQLNEGLSEHIEKSVSSGECDIGVVIRRTGFRVERSELETVKFADDNLFAIAASEEDNLIGETWPASLTLNHPLVFPPRGCIERASYERWARRQEVALNIAGEATSVAMRLELARHIGGVCLLPGIGLADLLQGGNWRAHRIEHDDYYRGIEWFVIFRRTEGDYLISAVVEEIRLQAEKLQGRSVESFAHSI